MLFPDGSSEDSTQYQGTPEAWRYEGNEHLETYSQIAADFALAL